MYQLGMINEPMQITKTLKYVKDFPLVSYNAIKEIEDDLYSQDDYDPFDLLLKKRSKSFEIKTLTKYDFWNKDSLLKEIEITDEMFADFELKNNAFSRRDSFLVENIKAKRKADKRKKMTSFLGALTT